MRILSHEIPSAVGQTVTVAGWVHRRRRLAAVSFLILRDRSGLSQIVVKAPETQTQLDELGEETVVQVTGTVAANPQAPGGAEIVDPVIQPLTEPAATPPIELWRLRGATDDLRGLAFETSFGYALGLELDATGFGMGTRGQRFSLVVDNGVVKQVNIEEKGEFRVSSAEHALTQL